MMAVYLILAGLMIWFVWPVVLLGLCAVCQTALTAARPRLGLLPPIGAGALAALTQHQAGNAWDMNGLAGLIWLVLQRYGICAFAGTLAGLAAGLAVYGGRRAALSWSAHRSREEG